MKKILFIFGTRPEAIKLSPVINVLKSYKKQFGVSICVTAQHRQMLDQIMKLFRIKSDFDLDIMLPNQTLFNITSRTLIKIEPVIKKVNPNIVVVQGDTTTAFAGALAAFYLKIPVAHIEAGLRTYNKYNPFPEEMNRLMIDRLTSLYLVPTVIAKRALINEGVDKTVVFVTGNTVIDALLSVAKNDNKFVNPGLNELKHWVQQSPVNKVILITAHRRENLGRPLLNICRAVNVLTKKYNNIKFVYPVHLNPMVQNVVYKALGKNKNVVLVKPTEYSDLVELLKLSHFVLTDSGGIQEEAPSLGKPVLVLRKTTERPEGVTAGTAKLVGTELKNIVRHAKLLLDNRAVYQKMAKAVNPYGDGKAAIRTIEAIEHYLGLRAKRPTEF